MCVYIVVQVLTLKYSGGETNTPAGLSMAINYGLAKSNGARDDYPDVLVLITDGYTTDTWADNLPEQVDSLRSKGIYVVGEIAGIYGRAICSI